MVIIMNLFLLFLVYSFLGYLGEVFILYIKTHELNHRGFLLGPYLPIYGVGALIITYVFKYINNYFLVYLLCLIIFTLLEYFTSFFIEKVFNIRLWDYSSYKYNLNGRVCLFKSIEFGFGGLFVIVFNRFIKKLIFSINIYFKCFLLITFITDFLVSIFVICDLKLNSNQKDGSNYLSKKVKKEIKKDLID